MKTSAIAPTICTGLKSLRILTKSEKNIQRQYLYNEVLDISRKLKVPATVHNELIDLPASTQAVIGKLNELGIDYKFLK